MHIERVSSSLRPLPVAISAGLAGGLLVWLYYTHYASGSWSDFDQVWLASHALMAGRDPYVEIPKAFPWPLYYPLPAAVVGIPFALLSLLQARVVFAAVSACVCTAVILRHRPHAWPLLLSAPFIYGLVRGQWAPLLVAGVFIPWLGSLIAVKPTVGLATLAYRPTRVPLMGAACLVVLSFAVQPSWPSEWLAATRNAPHLIVPALKPGGIILLAALGRWRRADARLLAVLACVPQTPSPYDLFPMALIPGTLRHSLIMGLSWNVLYLVTIATHPSELLTIHDGARLTHLIYWPLYFILGYVPALLAVLSPSPLAELPRDFARWPAERQRLYRILWSAVLGLVSVVALLWAFLIWRGA